MEEKKYLDLDGLKAYTEKLLKLFEEDEEKLKELFTNQMELGRLGVIEEEAH